MCRQIAGSFAQFEKARLVRSSEALGSASARQRARTKITAGDRSRVGHNRLYKQARCPVLSLVREIDD